MKLQRLLDWALALLSIAYGIWTRSPLWVLGGALGIGLAMYNPGARLQDWLRRHLSSRFQKPPVAR